MKLSKVLIVYKKSTYQIQAVEHRESKFIQFVESGHDTIARVKVAHSEHYDVLNSVKTELTKRGIETQVLARAELKETVTDYDLVISVGGDGTFLDASHFVQSIPLLGINSSRSSSFGHFCKANQTNIAETLNQIESDSIKPLSIARLELELNHCLLPNLILNEVLICHSNPAGTSRYFLELGNAKEEQRSGGIWVGPPAGSTGSMRAANGKILPIADRCFQYIVREPGARPYEKWQLTQGLLPESGQLKVISQMRTGALYIDGQHIEHEFALGDELVIRISKKNLLAYVDSDINAIFQ